MIRRTHVERLVTERDGHIRIRERVHTMETDAEGRVFYVEREEIRDTEDASAWFSTRRDGLPG